MIYHMYIICNLYVFFCVCIQILRFNINFCLVNLHKVELFLSGTVRLPEQCTNIADNINQSWDLYQKQFCTGNVLVCSVINDGQMSTKNNGQMSTKKIVATILDIIIRQHQNKTHHDRSCINQGQENSQNVDCYGSLKNFKHQSYT